MSSDSVALSVVRWKGAVYAATINNYTAAPYNPICGYTHEVFDLGYLNGSGERKVSSATISITSKGSLTYNPLTPKVFSDTDVAGHSFSVNDDVWVNSNWAGYSPKGFAPRYFSQGIAVEGVNTKGGLNNNGTNIVLPDWVQSFRVVRTKPANRVIASGLAMYCMKDTSKYAEKELDKIWFFSDDIDKNFVDISDWTRYKVEVVSPLGFFSEIYTFNNETFGDKDRSIDMITYARLLYNNTDINPLLDGHGGASGSLDASFPQFGKWRNDDIDRFTGNKQFGITNGVQTSFTTPASGRIGRSNYYELTLDSNIYVNPSSSGDEHINNPAVCRFHEPFYIVNIIDNNAVVEDNNINNYIETGHHQKIESILGNIDQTHLSFDLVDERFEDCISNKYTYLHSGASENVFIYIRDSIKDRAWLDITYKTDVEIQALVTDLATLGYSDVSTFVATVPIQRIYGLYYHTWGVNDRDFTVYFKDNSTLYTGGTKEMFIPSSGTTLIVKYDNRFPLKVFGGDTIIGESIFAPIDGMCNSDDKVKYAKDHQFHMGTGFPYYEWYINLNYNIIKSSHAALGCTIQSNHDAHLDYIRQLCVMFTSENKCHLPFSYNIASSGAVSLLQNFPRIHYVQRPQDWDNATVGNNFGTYLGGQQIDATYKTDFPEEYDIWYYGIRTIKNN